jgi:hypothetical protein
LSAILSFGLLAQLTTSADATERLRTISSTTESFRLWENHSDSPSTASFRDY